MQRTAIVVGILAILNSVAHSQGPIPDSWGPSNYVVLPAPGNGTYALGYDAVRHSYWQTDIDPRGNMYGYDAHGNYWTYDRRTNTRQYFPTEPRWQARCFTSIVDLC
jgi:hypothetical protein